MANRPRKSFGQRSEAQAAAHLSAGGYEIVETNWHHTVGELDIIARKDGVWVFVEVRARHSHTTEDALASINNKKRVRVVAAAHAYLSEHDLDDVPWRIDVVAIAVPRYGDPVVEHVEDAFDW